MLERLRNLLAPPERKASRTARLIALESGGRARWTPRDYAALAREGYQPNAIVLSRGAADRRGHRLAHLPALRGRGRARPRIRCSTCWRGRTRARTAPRFCEALGAHLLSPATPMSRRSARGDGEAQGARALRAAARPHEGGAGAGRLAARLRIHGQRRDACASTRAPALPPILQLTLFNPLDDYYGLSPLEAAAVAVDIHNAAAPGTRRCSTMRRGLPARWSMPGRKARRCRTSSSSG